MNADGVDPADRDPPFGNEPIDRSSITPRRSSAPGHDPIDDIPFADGLDDGLNDELDAVDDDDDDDDDPRERWDADDERRQHDQFAPPKEPCECYCLHCNRTFMSDQIWLQRIVGGRDGFDGFWMCPTSNCSGAGFTFDIFPTDPHHPANSGWSNDAEDDPDVDAELEEAFNPDDVGGADDTTAEYDPAESKYKQLDDEMGTSATDISEGDEWKLGLAPGEEAPPQMYWSENARKEWEAEQADYDAPDRRPRELDWSNRKDDCNEDDIPF